VIGDTFHPSLCLFVDSNRAVSYITQTQLCNFIFLQIELKELPYVRPRGSFVGRFVELVLHNKFVLRTQLDQLILSIPKRMRFGTKPLGMYINILQIFQN